jgi:hypothetical protein
VKRALASLAAAATVLFIAWCGGLNFDTRGLGLAITVYFAIGAAFLVYICPLWGGE